MIAENKNNPTKTVNVFVGLLKVFYGVRIVPSTRFELVRLSALDFKSSVSASSTSRALIKA